jgi:hypothetical protein
VAAHQKGPAVYEAVWADVAKSAARHAAHESSLSRAFRLTEAEWVGASVEAADGTAYGKRVTLPKAALHGARRALHSHVLTTVMPDADLVVELGSGWGNNLLDLYLAGGPRGRYFALEPTRLGRQAVESLATLEPSLDLTALPFDYERPDYGSLPTADRLLVFTSHSVEQIQQLPEVAITRLFEIADEIVGVHFEPVGWQIDPAAAGEVGATRAYSEANGYNENLWPLLNELADAAELTIETVVPDILHHKIWNASSLIVWRRSVSRAG